MPLISIQAAAQSASSFFTIFSKEIKAVSCSEFKFKLRNSRKAKLIDLGSQEEFMELHIPGSINCDNRNPKFRQMLEFMDKSRTYFIYCRTGERSDEAMRIMENMGFRRVYALLSGLQEWKGTLERSY